MISLSETLSKDDISMFKESYLHVFELFAVVNDNLERLSKTFWWTKHYSKINNVIDYVAYLRAMWERSEAFQYVIKYKEEVVGELSVHSIDWKSKRCEIGFWVSSKYEGQGIVSKAIRLIEIELKDKKLNRLEIRCHSNNSRVVSLAKMLNYDLDGTLKQYECDLNGIYRDVLIFSKCLSTE